MKTMTCKQLGGACNMEFHGNTFEEISDKSKQHGMEMFQQKDKAHLKAMIDMREAMKTSDSAEMKTWIKTKQEEFNALPDN